MQHDDDIAPAGARFFGEYHLAIRHRVNRIAEIAVLAADAIQIVAQVAILGERLGVVGERAMLAADREIEARGGRQRRQQDRRGQSETPDRFAPAGAVPGRAEREGRRRARAKK